MKMKIKRSRINADTKLICIINQKDAEKLGVDPLNRIILRDLNNKKRITSVVDTTTDLVQPGNIILDEKLANVLGVKNDDKIDVEPRKIVLSKSAIRKKIANKQMSLQDCKEIARDIVNRNLNDLEISSFITALTINGLSDKEAYYMARAMVETGKTLNFGKNSVDKHSIGGTPGDKTSLLIVPIIAASGLTIPKTSSRAITSPAGTADRMEVLAPVIKTKVQIKKIVRKVGGCLVWGGSFDLSPADDLFIEIERPLDQDPLLLPSVLSKKKVVGAKYVVIDMPVGPQAKVRTRKQAIELGNRFKKIGKMLGMIVDYVLTDGREPIGYAMGPAMEAREALEVLMNRRDAYLMKKAVKVCAVLFKISKKVKTLKQGEQLAKRIIFSGLAEKKLREIIAAQGGNSKIMPENISLAKFHKNIISKKSGRVAYIRLHPLQKISRLAGSPFNKKAGIYLNKKLNDRVKKGETIYTIYAENHHKLLDAVRFAKIDNGYHIK